MCICPATCSEEKGWEVSPAAGRRRMQPCFRRRPRGWSQPAAEKANGSHGWRRQELGGGEGYRHHLLLPAITRVQKKILMQHKNVMSWADEILHSKISSWISYYQILGASLELSCDWYLLKYEKWSAFQWIRVHSQNKQHVKSPWDEKSNYFTIRISARTCLPNASLIIYITSSLELMSPLITRLHNFLYFSKHKSMMPCADKILESKGTPWKCWISHTWSLELSCGMHLLKQEKQRAFQRIQFPKSKKSSESEDITCCILFISLLLIECIGGSIFNNRRSD
jgi:hypothetical protein